MRVHFQQLTEPITPLVDNHRLFEFALTHSVFQIPQLKSHARRSRRLPASLSKVLTTPRACGDPIRSPRCPR